MRGDETTVYICRDGEEAPVGRKERDKSLEGVRRSSSN